MQEHMHAYGYGVACGTARAAQKRVVLSCYAIHWKVLHSCGEAERPRELWTLGPYQGYLQSSGDEEGPRGAWGILPPLYHCLMPR